MTVMDANQEYAIKVMLDDITFMLFDLELGGFVLSGETVDIGEEFVVSYRRELIEETIVNGWKNIISDFYISATKNGVEFIKFETRGAQQKFTLYNIDGFVCGMFINKLEDFRKSKFSINN